MKYFDEADVMELGYPAAIAAITEALVGGLDPSRDPARTTVELSHGQYLLMPSEISDAAGVKVVTVAPGNPARGLSRIQAAYLLFDHETLTLNAILDGKALTTLRTPAVSVAAVVQALPPHDLDVVVIGSGPQATGHLHAIAAVRRLASTTYLVRDPTRAPVPCLTLGSHEAESALATADVVICATSAREPIFDSALLKATVIVIAVGSHEPDSRELDSALMNRATVIVEDVATAMREAGDVVMAIAEGALSSDELTTMVETISTLHTRSGPLVFKSVGMSWQDLVIATTVVRHQGGKK